MSFYAHPFSRRQAPAYGYPCATGPAASPAPSFNFYTAPPAHTRAASYYDDIDAEEQAALAHLHAIQRRREAAQLAARREAALQALLQAQIAAQREAAYAAVVERERAREEAIRHLIAEKQRQQEAAAHARAVEQQRRAQRFAAQRQAQAQAQAHALAARHAYAQRAIEEEKRAEEFLRRRNACARRCATGCAKKEETKEQKDDWKEINDVLASLFGINLNNDQEQAAKEDKPATPAATDVPANRESEQKSETVQPQPAAPAPAPAPSADNTKATEQSESASIDLNDLLSTFLGVSLEPAKEGEKATEGADKLTAKLNDFLSQFGLEFEATPNTAESSSSAAKPAPTPAPVQVDTPARAPTPASAPVEGKGKAVAEGEKPARPTTAPAQPAPAAETAEAPISKDTALDKLRDISHELHLATESFTFPSKLAFADTTHADATPALLFNKGNSGYHAQAHKLLQLLLAADGISSGGDREVRKQRKAIVKAIEGAIEQLEQKRDAIWAEVKEKREQGAESSDDEGSVSSWNSTEPEHIEHVNDETEVKEAESNSDEVEEEQKQEDKKEEQTHAEAAAPVEESKKEEVQGFDVPAQETPATEESKPSAAVETSEKKASTKEDDFELL